MQHVTANSLTRCTTTNSLLVEEGIKIKEQTKTKAAKKRSRQHEETVIGTTGAVQIRHERRKPLTKGNNFKKTNKPQQQEGKPECKNPVSWNCVSQPPLVSVRWNIQLAALNLILVC